MSQRPSFEQDDTGAVRWRSGSSTSASASSASAGAREFLKTNVADGTIEVVALVDVDPQALAYGRDALGVPPERCYTDAERAFAEVAGGLLHRRRDARASRTRDRPRPRARARRPVREADRRHDGRHRCGSPARSRRRTQDGRHDEPSLRPGQDDAAPHRALGRARQDQRDRHALPGRHAPAPGVELAVPPPDARPAADRRRDPSPRHHRRLRRRALRHAVRLDVEAELGRVRGRHGRHRDA